MKKQLGIVLLCCMGILAACTPSNKETVKQTGNQTEAASSQSMAETEAQVSETTADTQEQSISTYREIAELLGSEDNDIKDSFGGGMENKTEDGSVLIAREYKTMFKGEEVALFAMYGDNKKVNAVQVVLPGKDSKKYKDDISKELGMEAEDGGSMESGNAAATWSVDGVMYTLFGGAEESILEIIIPEN